VAPFIDPDLEKACEQHRAELLHFFERQALRPGSAEDLVQQVHMRMMRAHPVNRVLNPKAYMYRIAWRVLFADNMLLRQERERTVSYDPEQLAVLAAQADVLQIDDSTQYFDNEVFDSQVKMLPPQLQVPFVLHYRDDYTYAQIAKVLGVTSHTVKKYIVTGLDRLRAYARDGGPPKR
jgi:RNA polymerase sigma factor (sigma-70 family)